MQKIRKSPKVSTLMWRTACVLCGWDRENRHLICIQYTWMLSFLVINLEIAVSWPSSMVLIGFRRRSFRGGFRECLIFAWEEGVTFSSSWNDWNMRYDLTVPWWYAKSITPCRHLDVCLRFTAKYFEEKSHRFLKIISQKDERTTQNHNTLWFCKKTWHKPSPALFELALCQGGSGSICSADQSETISR